MMSFAAVFELVTIVTYCLVILGGKQKRETGWKILSFMLMLVGVIQCAAMAIVVSSLSELKLLWLNRVGICLRQ
jgi:formate hydrogenlyase subunit 3/multisubunit Na+/H+ antiporter MnhD subunit